MHAALLFPKEFLCAADLQNKDVPLTISKLVTEDLRTDKGDEPQWVLHFAEMEARVRKDRKQLNRRLVLNKTNAKTIQKLYGSETNDWIGKRIALFPTTCMAFGERVECVRIRDRAPSAPKKGSAEAEPAEIATGPECEACGEIGSHVKDCPNGAGGVMLNLELLEALHKRTSEQWFCEGVTDSGLTIVDDGQAHGMFSFHCETPEARFVVEAHNQLPAVLAHIRALEAESANLREALRKALETVPFSRLDR